MAPDHKDDELVPWQYPSAEMTAEEFEKFVVDEFHQTRPFVDDLIVKLHDVVQGTDGTYDFDATIRYRLAGLDFLVVVEAKRHSYPIKREVVQVLQAKVESVGAHKGVVVSTAPFQRGALNYAIAHGIALVKVTEGRFTFETGGVAPPPAPSRLEAAKLGVPTFVGYCYGSGDQPGSVAVTLVTEEAESAARLLLGLESVASS
jgi:hypothetical protein